MPNLTSHCCDLSHHLLHLCSHLALDFSSAGLHEVLLEADSSSNELSNLIQLGLVLITHLVVALFHLLVLVHLGIHGCLNHHVVLLKVIIRVKSSGDIRWEGRNVSHVHGFIFMYSASIQPSSWKMQISSDISLATSSTMSSTEGHLDGFLPFPLP